MFYMHIIDDYFLQRCLADLKQKDYWKKHPEYTSLYKNDYKMALFMHSFSWSFSISIPIIISYLFFDYNIDFILFIILFCINILIHYITDDLKANKKCINLIQDQLIHIVQIISTFILIYYY